MNSENGELLPGTFRAVTHGQRMTTNAAFMRFVIVTSQSELRHIAKIGSKTGRELQRSEPATYRCGLRPACFSPQTKRVKFSPGNPHFLGRRESPRCVSFQSWQAFWCWRWNSRLGLVVGPHSLKQLEQRLRDLRGEPAQRVEPYRHLRQTRRCLRPRQRQRIRQFRPWLHSNGHLRRRHRDERSTGGQTDRVAGAPRLYPATNVAVPTTANAILRQIDRTGLNRAASSILAQNWCFRDFD
jgi:hypothetical protein